uniref:Uncharacterized protein n=1 Tax=Aegilops tauschii subsp. strangulata TaxID=200361 RepID=A0A453RAL9_AEGTS
LSCRQPLLPAAKPGCFSTSSGLIRTRPWPRPRAGGQREGGAAPPHFRGGAAPIPDADSAGSWSCLRWGRGWWISAGTVDAGARAAVPPAKRRRAVAVPSLKTATAAAGRRPSSGSSSCAAPYSRPW